MLDAAATQGGRLPELFTGLGRDEFPTVVSYPTSCSPQAWAAAAPLHLLRTLLRFDPRLTAASLLFAPVVPQRYLPLRVRGLRVGQHLVEVEVGADGAWITGLEDTGVRVVPGPASHRE
jgi:glycogen debranching enzyme